MWLRVRLLILKKDTVGITKEATSNVGALGEPTDHLQLAYAKNFSIDYYEGGYKLLTIKDGTQILTVPEGKKAPDNLDESIIVMQQPVNNILSCFVGCYGYVSGTECA